MRFVMTLGILSKIMPILSMGLFCLSQKTAIAEQDATTQFVENWLKNGPITGEALSTTFKERSLSSMYQIDQEEGLPIWVKFRSFSFSQGGYFPKPITAPFSLEKYAQGQIRRWQSRQLIDKINAEAGRILIAPYHKKFPEYLLGDDVSIPYFLRHNVVTFWEHIEGETNPHCPSPYKWSPSEYPPWVISELANHLYKISQVASNILQKSEDLNALKQALHPEYGASVSKEILDLGKNLFNTFGVKITQFQNVEKELDHLDSPLHQELKNQAKCKLMEIEEKKNAIAQELKLSGSLSLKELMSKFLNQVEPNYRNALASHEKALEEISFLQALFSSEREGIWSKETYAKARTLAQLSLAQDIAIDICENQALLTTKLLKQVCSLEKYYHDLEKAPLGFVHGGAHPFQFMLTREKNWVLLDNDQTSVQFFLYDLATEFVGKIVHAHLKGDIDRGKTLEFLHAALIPEWTGNYSFNLLSCYILDFAKEMRTLSYAYSLDNEHISSLNLTITLSSFTQELEERITRDQFYRNELYPAWKSTFPTEKRNPSR